MCACEARGVKKRKAQRRAEEDRRSAVLDGGRGRKMYLHNRSPKDNKR